MTDQDAGSFALERNTAAPDASWSGEHDAGGDAEAGGGRHAVRRVLGRAASGRLRAAGAGSTETMIVAAWALLLGKTGGSRRVVLAVRQPDSADRRLTVELDPAETVAALVRQVARLLAGGDDGAPADGAPDGTISFDRRPRPVARDAAPDLRVHAALPVAFELHGCANGSAAADLLDRLAILIERAGDDAGRELRHLSILHPAEERLAWGSEGDPEPSDGTAPSITARFAAQVAMRGEATAIVAPDGERRSYRELAARAAEIAGALQAAGLDAAGRVALSMDKGIDLVAAMLGVLSIGAAYVPVPPDAPAERRRFILQDAAIGATLTQRAYEAGLDATEGLVIAVEDCTGTRPAAATEPPPGDRPAYVVYTSGTTGTPKGVEVSHRNLVNFCDWTLSIGVFTPGDRVAQFAPCSFDAAAGEIFGTLLGGCELHLIGDGLIRDPARFVAHLRAAAMRFVALPPSYLQHIDTAQLPDGITLMTAGAAPSPRLVAALGEGIRYINGYGPTETTILSTAWIRERHAASPEITIGSPISGTVVYVVDALEGLCAPGQLGEIWIGGAGVSLGYVNQAAMTAASFTADPFRPGGRVYRTGDLGRRRADGRIEFVGRRDDQVKLRGFRIELGEVQAAMLRLDGVQDAAVVLHRRGDEEGRLIAYLVPEAGGTTEGGGPGRALRWRVKAASLLPGYMVPSAFVTIAELPLTTHGKVDRKALPAPDGLDVLQRPYEAPETAAERQVAEVWQEVLGLRHVGRSDHFFELGGHSLQALTVIERLVSLGLGIEPSAFFAHPVLAEMARTAQPLARGGGLVAVPANLIPAGATVLTPDMLPLIDLTQADIDLLVGKIPGGVANIQDIYALTPLQQGILFHHQLAERGDPYIQVGRMWFRDGALRDRYVAAVARVVERHDILRTAFVWEGLREPAQVVLRHVVPAVTELVPDPAGGPVAEQLAARFDPRHHRMDLAAPPLLRLAHATDPATGRCEMLLLVHHLVEDISSIRILTDELLAIMTGDGARLSPAEPFRRLIAQVRLGKTAEQHERFFRGMLGDVEAPSAPYGLVDLHGDGGEITELQQRLPFALNSRLRAQARRLGVSLGSLCHLAWGQVVARLTGQDAVVFGTILFGRMQAGAGADRIMGPFINTLPFRLDIDDTGAEESVRRTHARLAELLGHEHAPLGLAQRCAALPPGSPLFTTLLNYRHNREGDNSLDIAVTDADKWYGYKERTTYPITLSVDDYGHALGLSVQVAASLSAARLFGYVQQALASLADALERTPGAPVRTLEVLPADERRLLLDTWNRTAHPFPNTLGLHQLFEQQAAATPDAVALRFGGEALSYAAFNRRANRLAHHLVARGVRPDSRVAVCAERGLPMVEALFAVLKAGGAYLPLDPGYPAERLAHMLADAAPTLVLADAAGRAALPASDAAVIDLEADAADWVGEAEHDLDPAALGLTARHLAYVIYTSGSTGRPKGVGNEHRALVNRILWMQRATPIGPGDAVLQKTPFGFDVSAWEFFWTLATGATLVVAPPDAHKDPFALASLIRDNAVTTLHFVPSMLTAFLGGADAARCTTLRQVICSGEALAPATLDRCHALLPGARVHNLYGPTEAAIDVTSWTAPAAGEAGAPATLVPIGRPISNLRIYLLDAHGRPVPLGAAGELHIGGVGVARGYLNRPELNAERFVPDPYGAEPGGTLYRTGDLARYAEDGEILYLGRNDHQIKLRGLRVELGEIEAALAALPTIGEAAVLARTDGAGETRLVAYVVTDNAGGDDANGENANGEDPAARIGRWRAALATTLPEHMVPAAFVTLDAMPLSPNGKLDRRALPEPGSDSFGRARHVPPQGHVETTLANIWAELLNIENIGRNDHFFELGGHSLLAVQLMEKLRQEGLSTDIRALFENPVLADFATQTVEITETRL